MAFRFLTSGGNPATLRKQSFLRRRLHNQMDQSGKPIVATCGARLSPTGPVGFPPTSFALRSNARGTLNRFSGDPASRRVWLFRLFSCLVKLCHRTARESRGFSNGWCHNLITRILKDVDTDGEIRVIGVNNLWNPQRETRPSNDRWRRLEFGTERAGCRSCRTPNPTSRIRHPPTFTGGGRQWPTRVEILKTGRNSAMTMPPMTTPSTAMTIGSIRLVRAVTAASTSFS